MTKAIILCRRETRKVKSRDLGRKASQGTSFGGSPLPQPCQVTTQGSIFFEPLLWIDRLGLRKLALLVFSMQKLGYSAPHSCQHCRGMMADPNGLRHYYDTVLNLSSHDIHRLKKELGQVDDDAPLKKGRRQIRGRFYPPRNQRIFDISMDDLKRGSSAGCPLHSWLLQAYSAPIENATRLPTFGVGIWNTHLRFFSLALRQPSVLNSESEVAIRYLDPTQFGQFAPIAFPGKLHPSSYLGLPVGAFGPMGFLSTCSDQSLSLGARSQYI